MPSKREIYLIDRCCDLLDEIDSLEEHIEGLEEIIESHNIYKQRLQRLVLRSQKTARDAAKLSRRKNLEVQDLSTKHQLLMKEILQHKQDQHDMEAEREIKEAMEGQE